jgi:hypothetical protein
MSQAPTLVHLGPTKAEKGKLVVSAAKALKVFRPDPTVTTELYASWEAGRIGLLASALRNQGRISLERFNSLASYEVFSPVDCRKSVLPALENRGLVHVRRQAGVIQEVESIVLTYEGMLEAIADIYEAAEPTPVDRACGRILFEASRVPMPQSAVLEALADDFDEETARKAVPIAVNYRIVAAKSGYGLSEPLLYSERVWSAKMAKASRVMAGLDKTGREVLITLIDKVRNYQGIPEVLIRREAVQHNAERLVDLAIGVGLLSRTEITMLDRTQRAFLTSPHFYAEVGDQFGEDTCDRVKIFLDSVRNGQHFGRSGTGRITDPDRLLRKLVNAGEIGPCTAIGTDYVTSEQAGIVRVKRSGFRAGQFVMEVLQRDTVQKVHSIVTTGTIPTSGMMNASDVAEGVEFKSIEQLRPDPGQVAASIAEIEREMILRLRES